MSRSRTSIKPHIGEFEFYPKLPNKVAGFPIAGTAYYHDFGKFLATFENTFPYMRVQRLVLEPAPAGRTAGDDGEKLAFKMEVLALVKPAPEATR